ncbi:hypothetical protein [Oryza sativa Japonica Group]|uniref:Uncharacterized protein n=1 Tax=Oryza sativa subsp. japonica TaxID=39947 RepID=Q5QLX0_ORYSJ|nr:hypothetical protein [Oryza sativa Japonica Group]
MCGTMDNGLQVAAGRIDDGCMPVGGRRPTLHACPGPAISLAAQRRDHHGRPRRRQPQPRPEAERLMLLSDQCYLLST